MSVHGDSDTELKQVHSEATVEMSEEDVQIQLRRSERNARPTEKMIEMKAIEEEKKQKQHKKAFSRNYDAWKAAVKIGRKTMKSQGESESNQLVFASVHSLYSKVLKAYEDLRTTCPPEQKLRRQMDTCDAISKQLFEIIRQRNEDDQADTHQELRDMLHQDTGSIFSSVAATRTNKTAISATSADKRLEAAADLAAKEAELQALKLKEEREAEMEKSQRKLEADMIELKRKQEVELEKKRREMTRMEKESEVKAAKAKFRVYDDECRDLYIDEDLRSLYEETRGATAREYNLPKPLKSSSSRAHHQTQDRENHHSQMGNAGDYFASLTQILQENMTLNRLPIPEPFIFSGNPLQFIEWRSLFNAFIARKNIPSLDKLYYLKRYVGGSALKVLDGTFYRDDHEAFEDAWKRLEERYGQPFIVQKAFRDKLSKWPKISFKDNTALQDFSDMLNTCRDAMPHFKGLHILDDCAENQKLLLKLPEWITNRWNRIVTEALERGQDYPNFEKFAAFVSKESKIACNPISSLAALRPIEPYSFKESRRSKTNVFATGARTETSTFTRGESEKFKPYCMFCHKDNHYIFKCIFFAKKLMEEKRQFIQDNKLCFGCLRKGHNSVDCRKRHVCEKCRRKHPTCLHDEDYIKAQQEKHRTQAQYTDSRKVEAAVSLKVIGGESNSTSMIVPVWISSGKTPSQEVLTYALLDTQSDSTFVLEETAAAIQADCQPVHLKLATMTSTSVTVQCQSVTDLYVRAMSSSVRIRIPTSYTRDFIPVDRSHIPTTTTARSWAHLHKIAEELPTLQDCNVGLLIGYNCPQALAPRETVVGRNGEPYAVKTDLGWSIVGHADKYRSENIGHCYRVSAKEVPVVTPRDIIKTLESDFVENQYQDKKVSQEDIQFVTLLSEKIHQQEDGHYEMPLPFKSSTPPVLPNNRKLAEIRLEHLKRKFKQDPKYHEHYQRFMKDILESGDAAPVEDNGEEGKKWYIPHFGVYHPKKPDKIRVVFDCSAKFGGTSLNEHLLTGPDLINNLSGVLLRFRQSPIAVICDIEKMFHQFEVNPKDRDYLRFLWWDEGDVSKTPSEFHMNVHLFGAASSPGCANFGLKQAAKDRADEFPAAAEFIQRNFYVDDGLQSVTTASEAIHLIQDTQQICKGAGMKLHKISSNDRDVINSIDPSERATNIKELNLDLDDLPMERALGIQWSIESDTFKFHVPAKESPATRRGILSIVASLYDPLGFVAPLTLKGKMVLQEMCRRGIAWDDTLPEDIRPVWESWKKELDELKNVTINRCYYPADFGKTVRTELHHFSDASTKGYGMCSYLRLKNEKGEVHCSLVVSKSRVTPIKLTSIPRLELTAAWVSAKVSCMLKEELGLNIDQEYFWTDSKVVLGYIRNEARRFHVFVANRVQRIRETTDVEQWHYVDTKENPADHASRGLTASELSSTNWFSGPKFLWEKEMYVKPEIAYTLSTGDPEVKVVRVLNTEATERSDLLHRLSRISKWNTLVNVVARIQRLALGIRSSKYVNVEEKEKATIAIIKIIQHDAFEKEIHALENSNKISRSSSVYSLDPFLHDGVLRVRGRLRKAPESLEIKHPIILPRGHISNLILTHYHEKTQHSGRGMTLNEVRSKGYWPIGGSKSVSNVISLCVQCRRKRRPVEEQKMADLPEDRVSSFPPFTYCGMDCFGPFIVKKNRKEIKRYGLLFTCFCCRGVHIEMIDDMTTDAFINALRCFIAIRGVVKQIRSDQGSNFVGATNELKEALKELDTDRIARYLAENQCEFILNVPHASHVGGVWERQIRSVRSILTTTIELSSGRLDDASLRTLFYEAMAIVNSRPLSVSSINDPKGPEALTPNHILTMKNGTALPPPGNFVKEDLYLRKRWRRVQYLCEQFWSRWRKEYLSHVMNRQKWHESRRNVQVGDIVLVKDEMVARNEWPLARVVETTVDDDGLVRKAKIQMGSSNLDRNGKRIGQRSILERPIQKLVVLLEV